jgi:hypothetical protein
MSNPLDDAFAKADSERATETRMRREKEQATELAVRDWVRACGEVLAAIPRHVSREPEKVTLAWSPEVEPPSSVRPVGKGRDRRGSSFAFGACEAWRFAEFDPEEESRTEFFVSADCGSLFTTEAFTTVKIKWRLGRGALAQELGPFVDVQTGRHTLKLGVSPAYGNPPYRIVSSNLPEPTTLAEIIARRELAES